MNIDKSVLCCDDVFRRVSRFCLSRTTTTTNNNYSTYEEEEEEEEEKKMGDEKSKKFENGYELFTKNLYKKENKPCRKYSTARNTTTMSTNTGTSVSSSR